MDTDFDPAEAALVSHTLKVGSQTRDLLQIHKSLDQFEVGAVGAGGDAVEMAFIAFKTAVIEIATNILRHAHPPGHPATAVSLQLYLFPARLEAIFHDQGIAFTAPGEITPPLLGDIMDLPEGHLGLFLASQALDHLEYSRTPAGVNQWRLVKQILKPS